MGRNGALGGPHRSFIVDIRMNDQKMVLYLPNADGAIIEDAVASGASSRTMTRTRYQSIDGPV